LVAEEEFLGAPVNGVLDGPHVLARRLPEVFRADGRLHDAGGETPTRWLLRSDYPGHKLGPHEALTLTVLAQADTSAIDGEALVIAHVGLVGNPAAVFNDHLDQQHITGLAVWF
jgi:hypothetical protein